VSDPALGAIDEFIAARGIDPARSGWKLSLPKPPTVEFDPAKRYFWDIETNLGAIEIKLMPDTAPAHVSSTLYLTRLGFYDDLSFHRVISEFMAQGGCPRGTGTGGPGYEYEGEYDASVRHDKPGLLSMANAGPGTDGSQFFLTFVPTPWLDGKHTIFGEVTNGMDVVAELEKRGSRGGEPSEPLSLVRATVRVE
jgi:peptidyl-prolyl cis-trans isomerase B (cyclophilin B)